MFRCFRSNSRSGFTLFEISIVLLMAGFISAGGIKLIGLYSSAMRHNTTLINVGVVDRALHYYFQSYGSLPKPVNAVEFDDDFLYGTVPYEELNISPNVAKDGYGHALSFIVVKNLTEDNLFFVNYNDTGKYAVDFGNEGEFDDISHFLTVLNFKREVLSEEAAYITLSAGKNALGYLKTPRKSCVRNYAPSGSSDEVNALLNASCGLREGSSFVYISEKKGTRDIDDDYLSYKTITDLIVRSLSSLDIGCAARKFVANVTNDTGHILENDVEHLFHRGKGGEVSFAYDPSQLNCISRYGLSRSRTIPQATCDSSGVWSEFIPLSCNLVRKVH